MAFLNFIFSFLYITFQINLSELLCLSELDPICLVEMDNFKQQIPDAKTTGEFISGLLLFTVGPDSSDARNAMIPHILDGLAFQPNIDCAGGEIFDATLESKDGDNGLNGNTKVNIDINDQYLDKNDINNWQNPDYKLSQTSTNKYYSSSVISTLRHIAENEIKPLFDAVGFDANLALAVTFSLSSCIDVNILGVEISGCASFGYGVAMNGKNEIKYFVTGGISTGNSISSFDVPFGFDYSISYDFFGDIGYVSGISSSVGIGVDFSVSPTLGLLSGILGGIMIPTGVGFQIGYNSPIILIDCYSWGFSIKGYSTASIEIGYAVSNDITSWISDNSINDGECNTQLINFGFSESPLDGPCLVHEHCAGHGLALNAVACCANKCKVKNNGFCPKSAIGEDCCFGLDCKGYDGISDNIACCNGKCDYTQKDYLGIKWCPRECKLGPTCQHGTCENKSNKLENENCSCHEECKGYGLGLNDMACCHGKCEEKKNGFCGFRKEGETCSLFSDCLNWGKIDGLSCCFGICEQKQNGFCPPQELGEICNVHTDCKNYGPGTTDVACCKGICTKKVADWLGVGYCPNECSAGIGCAGGTCDFIKSENKKSLDSNCNCHAKCKSGCCENGKCTGKVDDYLGIGWCPSECKLEPQCAAGTCGQRRSKDEGQTCSCHEVCKGYGLGLNDMACCGGTCEQKKNGFCGWRELGESCSVHTDCRNFGPGNNDVACCQNKCTKKVTDYAGHGFCPHECRKGLGCPTGTCETSRGEEGESCSCHELCKGYGPLKTDMACCNGKCEQKVEDYLNLGWCPHQCKAGLFCPQGSCDDSFGEGESCGCDEQCSGGKECCSGKCTTLIGDYLGIKWCPHECKAGPFCGTGSCQDNFGENTSCQCNEQCGGGRKCCNGKCKTLLSDYLNIKWCPHECKASISCSKGTCPKNRSNGQSCSCKGQCSSGCCEGSKCVAKKKDYLGIKWCPADCKGGMFKKKGTC